MHIKQSILVVLVSLSGCASPLLTNVHQPTSVRPPIAASPSQTNGAILQVGYNEKPLFEDRRARNVGDTLVINIIEKNNASTKSNSSAERNSEIDVGSPTIQGLPGKTFQGIRLASNTSHTFDGKGETASNNLFTGSIAVTVIEVLPNGNLLVSGEKQIAINQGQEYIRFSGVVKPDTINGNAVSSTQVADARIEYKQGGYIGSAQTMPWLARFFLSILPF